MTHVQNIMNETNTNLDPILADLGMLVCAPCLMFGTAGLILMCKVMKNHGNSFAILSYDLYLHGGTFKLRYTIGYRADYWPQSYGKLFFISLQCIARILTSNISYPPEGAG